MYNTFVTTGASTTKRLVTASEFVTLAGFRMPDMITRTLTNNFLVGMYSLGENSPFVIFKTSSFENTYAGMIAWEKYLEKDFTLLFKLNGTDVGAKFEDKVVVNKDTRILRDAEGKTTFLYAILDKDTIVITVNENAFKEIVSRLNKEKGLKR
jgi:hypothetical protein